MTPEPTPTTPAWDDVMIPNYGTPALTITSGQGCTVTDTDGRRYVDLLAGVAVNVLGHCHPAIQGAVQAQAARLGHVSNLYAHPPGLQLAARLRDAAGGGHKVLFTNSGTEANEAALKLVRKRAHDMGRGDGVILAFQGSFHGRTMGALALTGQPKHQAGFAPLPGGILHVPFNDPAALETAFADHDVVGAFFEPIQGEGGVVPMDSETADTLARLCREKDALLVADEVQTGVGRTGRFFGFQHLGLEPHVITMAKGLGGGLPIGACLVQDPYVAVLGPGTHGCTFGGHPISCAAALAVLDTLEVEGLVAATAEKGQRIATTLRAAGIPARGQGLLWGVPVPDAKGVQARMQRDGYLVGIAGPGVVRLAPPLVIMDAELAGALTALVAAVEACAEPAVAAQN